MDRLSTARVCLRQLELEPGVRWGDVRRAYRTLAQVWHPDRFQQGTEVYRTASERLKEITSAYRWLREHRDLLDELAPPEVAPPEIEELPTTTQRASRPAYGRGWAFRPTRPRRAARTDKTDRSRPGAPLYRSRSAWALIAALIAGTVFVLNEAGYSLIPTRSRAAVPSPPVELFVQASALRVRRSPNANSPTVGLIRRGQRVRVTDTYEKWRRLVAENDSSLTLGWIDGELLAQEPPPVPTRPPATASAEAAPPGRAPAQPGEDPVQMFAAPDLPAAEVAGEAVAGEAEPRWDDIYVGAERTPANRLAPPEDGWRRRIEWRGEAPAQTEPITRSAAGWRLAWRAWGSGTGSVEVFEAETERLVTVIELRPTRGTSYFHIDRPGSYFLRIWPMQVSWLIAIEEAD